MFRHMKSFFLALVVMFSESSSRIAPDFIQTCPGLKADCLTKNVQQTLPLFAKGIPSLGIMSLDPLHQNRVDLELPGGLKIEFTDGIMTGFRKCIIDTVKYEDSALEAQFNFHCNLTIKGKYKAKGQILIVGINGDGDAKIKTPNIRFSNKVRFEDKTRDGVVYRVIKDYKVDYHYGNPVTFALTNLFKGNPQLSEVVLQYLNENWKLVVEEFGKPVVDTVVRLIFENIKKFFETVPRDELYVPE